MSVWVFLLGVVVVGILSGVLGVLIGRLTGLSGNVVGTAISGAGAYALFTWYQSRSKKK
mgnify:CR=1 FL=1